MNVFKFFIGKWVSVKKRLPQAGNYVLVTVRPKEGRGIKHNYVQEAMYIPRHYWEVYDVICEEDYDYDEENDIYYWKEGWYFPENDEMLYLVDGEVTHWMPSPKPIE